MTELEQCEKRLRAVQLGRSLREAEVKSITARLKHQRMRIGELMQIEEALKLLIVWYQEQRHKTGVQRLFGSN